MSVLSQHAPLNNTNRNWERYITKAAKSKVTADDVVSYCLSIYNEEETTVKVEDIPLAIPGIETLPEGSTGIYRLPWSVWSSAGRLQKNEGPSVDIYYEDPGFLCTLEVSPIAICNEDKDLVCEILSCHYSD